MLTASKRNECHKCMNKWHVATGLKPFENLSYKLNPSYEKKVSYKLHINLQVTNASSNSNLQTFFILSLFSHIALNFLLVYGNDEVGKWLLV